MRKVLEGFKNLKDNLSVFIFICVLIAAYILLLVLLRKKDRADSKKVRINNNFVDFLTTGIHTKLDGI